MTSEKEKRLCPTILRMRLRYDAESGDLFWKRAPDFFFKDGLYGRKKSADRWNSRYAGTLALNYVNENGYKIGKMMGFVVRSHRAAWAIETGHWPSDDIDHDNRDRTDNRFKNLMDMTRAANMMNTKAKGVSYCKLKNKWNAYCGPAGPGRNLGYYDTEKEAKQVRDAAHAKLKRAILKAQNIDITET